MNTCRNQSPLQFRWQRGSLAQSLTTVVEFKCMADLVEILNQELLIKTDHTKVGVSRYTHDLRTGWNTYIVTVNGEGVGFTNGPVEILKYSGDAPI